MQGDAAHGGQGGSSSSSGAGGGEGGGGFTFNFFGGGAGASAANAASDANNAAAAAAADAAADAQAEAAADALLASINEEGPPPEGWAYREAAEEVEDIAIPDAANGASGATATATATTEVELPGCGGLSLSRCTVPGGAAAALLGQEEVGASDLVPGRYEGGFKLWEGGVDLAAYLARLHGLTSPQALFGAGSGGGGGSGGSGGAATGLEVSGARARSLWASRVL